MPADNGTEHIWISGIGRVPIRDEQSSSEVAANDQAMKLAEELHSPEQLQAALLEHPDPEVRWRVVDRLVARGADHPKTLPTLFRGLAEDPSWKVRDAVALALTSFPSSAVLSELLKAKDDENQEVRESVRYAIQQLGH